MDESVMLFLLMRPNVPFTKALVKQVREKIREGLSARHVPKFVFETKEIPVGWELSCFGFFHFGFSHTS